MANFVFDNVADSTLATSQVLKAIQKLFVWVPKGITFDPETTKGSESIYFNSQDNGIYVNGIKFGVSSDAAADIVELQNILAGFKKGDGEPANATFKTVADALTSLKNELLGVGTTGEDGKTSYPEHTINNVDERVKSIENLIGAADDDNNTIDKLQEVLDWFKGVSEQGEDTYKVTVGNKEVELGKGQAGLLTTVAENKVAIGEKGTAATEEVSHAATQEDVDAGKAENIGDKVVDTPASEGTPSTGLYKEIEDVKDELEEAIEDLQEELQADSANAVFTAATETDAAKLELSELKEGQEAATTLLNASSVEAIKKYVDAVSAAKDVTAKVNGVASDETYIAVENSDAAHSINLKTSTLTGVLGGIDKNEAGKYVFTAADDVVDGLATAADVAAVIVSDEEVIAAAFNDHESRLAAVENLQIWSIYGA